MKELTEDEKQALWKACLAKAEVVKRTGPGQWSSLSSPYYSHSACLVILEMAQEDGTTDVHQIEAYAPFGGELTVKDKISTHSSEDFWEEQIADPTGRVVVGSTHYRILPEGDRGFRGHGGRKFVIRFHNGPEVVTTNLWYQGTIPPKFRDRLPADAVFVPQPVTQISLER